MKRLLVILLLWLGCSGIAWARDSVKGWCEQGNQPVKTSGINSTTRVQASHPSCTVTVYVHGGGLATIYSDNNNTPLANPFTAQSGGQWQAYANNGRYDVTMSSAGFTQTITYSDIILCDPFEVGSTCNNGGATQAHNLLSTTHLDTIPASPPIRGDLVTAQNQTSPTGVNPSWARLPLGTAGQVLLSNGIDALWGNLVAGTNITITNTGSPSGSTVTISSTGGGSGCTLPGVDKGVLSEHPAGTCYDGLDWTWDDGLNEQNMLQGDGSNHVFNTVNLTFTQGRGNSQTYTTQSWITGVNNSSTCDVNTTGSSNCYNFFNIGNNNLITDTGASSSANLLWQMGQAGTITVTGGSAADDVMLFMDNNLAQSLTGGHIDHIWEAGKTNQVQASGSSSVVSSIFQTGEVLKALGGASSTVSDNVQMGESSTLQASATGAQVGFATQLGYNHLIKTLTNSVVLNYGFQLGHANVTSTGATTSMTDFGMVGHNISLVNCSSCFAFGENIVQSTSNSLYLGMSATPEIIVTANTVGLASTVTITATAFASLGTPANGTFKYCNDCTIANPCASGGSGAFAKRLNGVWVCN